MKHYTPCIVAIIITMLLFCMLPYVLAAETDSKLPMTSMRTTKSEVDDEGFVLQVKELLGNLKNELTRQNAQTTAELSEKIDRQSSQTTAELSEKIDRQSSQTIELSERIAVLSERTAVRMHKFEERNAVQLDTLFNTTAELKLSLQHQSVSTIGGYQLSDRVVEHIVFYTLLFTTFIICFKLLPVSARRHVTILIPTAIRDGIEAVWATTTRDKVRELAVFVILLCILPNIPFVHKLLVEAVRD